MINKSDINQLYYYTDIEPAIESLTEIIKICDIFEKEGTKRLMCALSMRKYDVEEVIHWKEYIVKARQKMEIEKNRLLRKKDDFNSNFATNHNKYFNSAAELLAHIRSHTSPLKQVLRKTCSPNHPTKRDCKIHNIEPKSVRKESVLASEEYQGVLFDINEPTTPQEVISLYNEMQAFFREEKECFEICKEVLDEEAEIRKDPVKSKYILDKYRRKAQEKLYSQIPLITEEVIDTLKVICPAYQKFCCFATDEAFAQEEFHKHNVADMDHFCEIELFEARLADGIGKEEIAIWGNNPNWIKKIKLVIDHFDDLLPSSFKHKKMGEFQYYFCKWALPSNIRKATDYFIKHYKGKFKVSKYGSVNSHGKKYDQQSEEVKTFLNAIQTLLKGSFNQESAICNV